MDRILKDPHTGASTHDTETGAGFAPSRRQILAGALVGGPMVALRLPGVAHASTPSPGPTACDPMAHACAFQDITERCGGRSAGATGYEQSARYVEKVMRAAGYDVYR